MHAGCSSQQDQGSPSSTWDRSTAPSCYLADPVCGLQLSSGAAAVCGSVRMQCSRRISMALQPRHENPRWIRRTTTGFVEIFPPRRVSTPTSGAWIMAPIPHPGRRPPCIPPRAPCGLLRQATGAPCAASCSPLCGCMQHAHPAPLAPCSPPSAKAASCDAMELPFLSKVHGESTFMQGQCHGRLELFRSSTSISSSMTLRSSPMEGHRRSNRPSDGGGRMMLTGWRLLLCCMV